VIAAKHDAGHGERWQTSVGGLDRRHLNREQKRALVAEAVQADPQLTDREHARRTGVSHVMVGKIRDELVESGQVDHFSERLDPRTGKASQPASKSSAPANVNPDTGEVLGILGAGDIERALPRRASRSPIATRKRSLTCEEGA
jgi:hypothetical protein